MQLPYKRVLAKAKTLSPFADSIYYHGTSRVIIFQLPEREFELSDPKSMPSCICMGRCTFDGIIFHIHREKPI